MSHKLPDTDVLLGQLAEISQQACPLVSQTLDNLRAQIGIQSDAAATLNRAFAEIKRLQAWQQNYVLELIGSGGGSELFTAQTGQMMAQLDQAMRALQFEDMSTQNMAYMMDQLASLLPLLAALENPAYLAEVLGSYKSDPQRTRHNPVSASSVASGTIDFF